LREKLFKIRTAAAALRAKLFLVLFLPTLPFVRGDAIYYAFMLAGGTVLLVTVLLPTLLWTIGLKYRWVLWMRKQEQLPWP